MILDENNEYTTIRSMLFDPSQTVELNGVVVTVLMMMNATGKDCVSRTNVSVIATGCVLIVRWD